MTRRALLFGAGATACACALPVHAQWPRENRAVADLPPIGRPLDGCLKGLLSEMRVSSFSDAPVDSAVADMFIYCQVALGLGNATAAVFDGPDAFNAFASTIPLAFHARTHEDGTVLIGRDLILSEQRKRKAHWHSTIAMVVAHESSHLLQYKRGLTGPIPLMELHADYLAGWTCAHVRQFKLTEHSQDQLTLGRPVEAAMRDIAGTDDASIRSHGAARRRVAAFRSGRRAFQLYPDTPPFDEGKRYVGLS